jgi:protein-S-isoprenylcysteine O-methyltransferase Ste14
MRASALVVTVAPPIAFAIIFIALAQPPWPTYRLLGLALAIIGFTGLTIARFTLGDSFSIAPEARKLVTTGIYSRVRHPVYSFGMIAIAGVLLYLQLPWVCLVLVPVAILQVKRAHAEEGVLFEKFGEAYLQYKRQTWF